MISINKVLLVLACVVFSASGSLSFAADNNNDLNSHDTVFGAVVNTGTSNYVSSDNNSICGSPTLIADGAFIWSDTDIILNGRPNLSLTRHYNSYDSRDGIFGKGWSARCEKSLTKVIEYEKNDSGISEPRLTYIYRTAIGRRYSFVETGTGSFLSPDGLPGITLSAANNGSVELRGQNKSVERYNGLGQLTAEIDRNGNAVNYSYQNGVLAKMADNNGRALEFTFDSSGHVTRVADQTGRAWQYAYNAEGTLASVTDPMGGVMRYAYVPIIRPADSHEYQAISQITDPTGVVITSVSYLDNGRVGTYTEGENTYTYSVGRDGYFYKDDTMRSQWRYKLDEAGNKTEVWTSSSRFTPDRFEYNQDAQLVKYTDRGLTEFTFEHDLLGRVTGATTPDGKSTYSYLDATNWVASVTSVSGRTVGFSYDAKGNVTQVKDPAGNVAKYTWNAQGDLITATDPLGNAVAQEVNSIGLTVRATDPLARSSTFVYDNRGNTLAVTNAAGDSTTFEYDALDRLMRSTDALGYITQYNYDAAGRLLQLTDPAGGVTAFSYDSYGRVSSETRADGSVYNYTYRTDNLLATSTDPRGIVTQYTYDVAKRLTATVAGNDRFRYTYDDLDRLTQARGGPIVSMTYDSMHRLLTESQGTATTTYRYNTEGELIAMDAVGETLSYGYDNRGLLNTFTTPAGTHSYTHDSAGRLVSRTYPNGSVAKMSYDAASQLLQQDYSLLGGPDLRYSYDTLGRVSNIKGKGASDWNYQYDAISRLVAATHDQNYSYQYDALGNRLDNGGVYDIFNKLLENNDYSYSYDEAGSMINRVNKATGEEMRLSYNGYGRMSAVEIAPAVGATATTTASYIYDAFGRRTRKTIPGEITSYQWQGNNLLAEVEASAVTALYRYDGGYSSAEFVASSGETNQVLSDYLGNPETLVTVARNLVWQSATGPFGSDISVGIVGSSVEYDQRFPGQYFDEETGFSYNRFRYYDPSTGAYIRSDPLGVDGGINNYSYALSSPTLYLDPMGLEATTVARSSWYYPNYPSKSGAIPIPSKKPSNLNSRRDPNAHIRFPESAFQTYRDPTVSSGATSIISQKIDWKRFAGCMVGIAGNAAAESAASTAINNGIIKNRYAPLVMREVCTVAGRFTPIVGQASTAYELKQCLSESTMTSYPTGRRGYGR